MKKKFLVLFGILSLNISCMFAQTDNDIRSQINSIKKNTEYIYADVTAPTSSEAFDLAYESLFAAINKWAATQPNLVGTKNIVVNNSHEMWTKMEMVRGNMIRAFVFVNKKDLIGTETTHVISNTNKLDSDGNNVVQENTKDVPSMDFPKVAITLSEIEMYSDAAKMLPKMKNQRKIKAYERYENLTDVTDYYLIIYDKEGKVRAVLSPGPDRINVKTRMPDSIENYKELGATCFRVK